MRLRLATMFTLLVVLGLAALSGDFPSGLSQVPEDLADVRPEHVAFVRYIPPIPLFGGAVPRPLYGGRPGDRPWIAKLLRGLASTQPTGPPSVKTWPRYADGLEVRLVNGRSILVRDAQDCQTSGNRTSCGAVPGKMVIAEGEQQRVAAAPELQAFLHRDRDGAMPAVEQFEIEPRQPLIGGRLTVQGDGWAGGTSFQLGMEQKGEHLVELAVGPVTFGAFRWTGWIPRHLQAGEYMLHLRVEPGAKITRSITFRAAHP